MTEEPAERILIVDDGADVREVLMLLKSAPEAASKRPSVAALIDMNYLRDAVP